MESTLNISGADLLAELETMLPGEGEGLITTTELMQKLGCSRGKVLAMLHKLGAEDRLIEGSKTIDYSLGDREPSVPAYGLRKPQIS